MSGKTPVLINWIHFFVLQVINTKLTFPTKIGLFVVYSPHWVRLHTMQRGKVRLEHRSVKDSTSNLKAFYNHSAPDPFQVFYSIFLPDLGFSSNDHGARENRLSKDFHPSIHLIIYLSIWHVLAFIQSMVLAG